MTKSNIIMGCLLTVVVTISTLLGNCIAAGMNQCYLPDGDAQRCLPPFVNAAFGKYVDASNTCGTPPEPYCLQTGVTGVTTSCHECDNSIPSKRHDTSYLTDLTDQKDSTWWQSSTMMESVQYPNMVNLTLNLHKAFDITYVRLKFHTSRPESFAIYKKKCEECDWQPFQYYSGSCFSTYGLDNKEIVTVDNEQKALCTDDYSDISPLTGGNVAFSTLESRPSAYNFDRSQVLQDWVKAVAIRITLNRINTFGDEVFRDPEVLRSYYYAISDLSVGGRCACNGHASECYLGPDDFLRCRCEHNTAGRDCERCADMFNDRPWSRATRDNPAVCQECDCNGLSDSCYFDTELYRRTGHGGHCTECRDNTDGPHCEVCKPFHYRDPRSNRCVACDCSGIGASDPQCNADGQCTCKPGVGGARCDHCLPHFYGLSEAGCRECMCSEAGTVEGSVCNPETGACVCKLNVEGTRCDVCKPTTMQGSLKASNPYGCTSCFCHGQSSVCSMAEGYTVAYILSEFTTGNDGWHGADFHNRPLPVSHEDNGISMLPEEYYQSYFVAPDKFLGDQIYSYNQMLEFELYLEGAPGDLQDFASGEDPSAYGTAIPSRDDIILEGYGFKVSASITSQGNPLPTSTPQLYKFRLHEAAGFSPRLSPIDFQKMLNNLDAIKIRSTYGPGLVGHLDNVQLTTAEKDGAGPPADWVERCHGSSSNDGLSYDKCAPGYTRDPPGGDEFDICVPCNCNGHSVTCDGETGVCDCQHNTMGDHCELCKDGYYFSGEESRRGTPQECQPCPCPQGSACAVADDDMIVCTSCPPGHAGRQCEICMDGWFGDPRGRGPCLRCMCNGNVDDNAVLNCNRTTGECLKCIYNTTGFHCENCLPGYFGKPVTTNPTERCRLCECNSMGSLHESMCDAATGKCQCLPNVEGRQCDRCRSGFWNINSGEGCEACNCHQIGATTGECDQDSGQCVCLPGVGGQRCDKCLPNYYGLSRDGCSACECNTDGSETLQCGEDGSCVCKDGVYGVKCDQCQENFYDITNGCIECPACYGLVQNAVDTHRHELGRLEHLVDNIGDQPIDGTNGDKNFQNVLKHLNDTVLQLLEEAKKIEEQQNALMNKTDEMADVLKDLIVKLAGVEDNVDQCNVTVQEANEMNSASKDDVTVIRNALGNAQTKLNQAMKDLMTAQRIAEDSLTKEDNMSRIAQEAVALATRHKNAAQNITDTSQEALDTSQRAERLITDAIGILKDLVTSLDEMAESGTKISAVRALRDDLLRQTGVVRNNAEAAKNDSTDLFTGAGKLVVPTVDTDSMNTRAQDIESESNALLPRIDELEDTYKRNQNEVQEEMARAKELYDSADARQDNADMILAQVYSALQDGMEAVRQGNNTYQAVMDTLRSLESFDEAISMNEAKAKKALAKADAIQAKIDDANAKTNEARTALGTASSIATQANDKAQQALQIAENVQNSAESIRSRADESHAQAGMIASDVGSLEGELVDTESMLKQAEEKVTSDKKSVEKTTRDATTAKSTAERSKDMVDNILRQLQSLLLRLQNMNDVDDEQIKQLEDEYRRLNKDVMEAGLSDILSDLQREVSRQNQLLSAYDDEIGKLEAEIANLRDISRSIPKECSSITNVEQP